MYGATIGKLGILDIESTTNQACCACYKYWIEQLYLFYFLLAWKRRFIELSRGGAQPNISKEKIESTYFPCPPIQEQKRIVLAYASFDRFITSLEQDKEALSNAISQAKSKVLALAMQGKLVPQDPTEEPAAEMLRRVNPKAKIITDNPHSWKIPKNWVWCQLGDIFNHNTGKALNSSDKEGVEYEYITTSNVYWDRLELESLKKMPFKESEIEKCSVKCGDLLVCEGGDVGRAAIWNLNNTVMIQNHLHRLRPITSEIFAPLYCKVLKLYKDKNLIGGKGITLQGFSSNALHKLIVPLMPFNEQRRIMLKIEELYSILDKIAASLPS